MCAITLPLTERLRSYTPTAESNIKHLQTTTMLRKTSFSLDCVRLLSKACNFKLWNILIWCMRIFQVGFFLPLFVSKFLHALLLSFFSVFFTLANFCSSYPFWLSQKVECLLRTKPRKQIKNTWFRWLYH